MCRKPGKKATSVHVVLAFSFKVLCSYKISNVARLCACQRACMHTPDYAELTQSRIQTIQVIPISPLLEKVFTHGQIQDVSPGWEQGFTWHPTSPISLGCSQLLLNVVSSGLNVFVSPVQSTSLQRLVTPITKLSFDWLCSIAIPLTHANMQESIKKPHSCMQCTKYFTSCTRISINKSCENLY